jgi:hypothetical protein
VLSLPIDEPFEGTGWVPGAVEEVEVSTTPPPEPSSAATPPPPSPTEPEPTPTLTPETSKQPQIGDPCGPQYVVGEAHPSLPLVCSADCQAYWDSNVPVWRPSLGGCR